MFHISNYTIVPKKNICEKKFVFQIYKKIFWEREKKFQIKKFIYEKMKKKNCLINYFTRNI